MKKFFILLVALISVNGATGQSNLPCLTCLPQGIIFTRQAQIDNFQINYPNCTEIEGSVFIENSYLGCDITNLNGLNVLTTIGGELVIQDVNTLNSLLGLDNLTNIGGNLHIEYNDALASLAGLEDLTSITGRVDFRRGKLCYIM